MLALRHFMDVHLRRNRFIFQPGVFAINNMEFARWFYPRFLVFFARMLMKSTRLSRITDEFHVISMKTIFSVDVVSTFYADAVFGIYQSCGHGERPKNEPYTNLTN